MAVVNIPNVAEFAQRIKIARTLVPISREEFCRRFQFNRHMILAWEMGQVTTVSDLHLYLFCTILATQNIQCTLEWLLTGEGHKPSSKHDAEKSSSARIISFRSERFYRSVVRDTEDALREEFRLFYKLHRTLLGNKAWVLSLKDNSMEPFYKKGDYVGVRQIPLDRINEKPQTLMIEIQSGFFTLRNIRLKDNLYILEPTNAKFDESTRTDLEAVYEIVLYRRDI